MAWKTVDTNSWQRKEHFDFFSQFDEPFFGIVSEVDCTKAYKLSKENKYSFFAYYLHKSLSAINEIQEFKYRLYEKDIIIYDQIHASPTIGRDDGTFGFAFISFDNDFNTFSTALSSEVNRVQNASGLAQNKNTLRNDVIHYSSIPWIKFTGLTHARNFKFADSVPKISFGKISKNKNNIYIPVSVNAHHGFLDGLHVAKYLDLFQELLN